jgi:hypothetical protein
MCSTFGEEEQGKIASSLRLDKVHRDILGINIFTKDNNVGNYCSVVFAVYVYAYLYLCDADRLYQSGEA